MPPVGSGRTMLALVPQILHRAWQCSRRLIDKFLLQRQYLQISNASVPGGSAVECNKLGLHNAGGRAMELKGSRPGGVSPALKFYLQLGPVVYAAERQGARPGLGES